MGLFDFFKNKKQQKTQTSKNEKKLSKEEVDNLVLQALNVLCDDVSTIVDAKKLIQSKGYSERQTDIIVNRANELYQKHFQNKNDTSENPDRIDDSTFNSIQFHKEACALALWKIEESDYKRENAIKELGNIGLDNNQIRIILEQVKPFLNQKLNETFASNSGIDNILFESHEKQAEILLKAENWYQENILNYELVKYNLLKDGLSVSQVEVIISKLKTKVTEMVNGFQKKLDSGEISEIKIQPNPEHKKENVNKDQIDRYIAYGAYQMERGDLENALELFDKAIELDENATLAYANKGKLFSLKKDNEKALLFINKALELDSTNKLILDNKVNIVFDLFCDYKIDDEDFINSMKDILKHDPESPNATLYIIQSYLKSNDYENALIYAKNIFKTYYNDTQVSHTLLDIFYKLPEERVEEEFRNLEKQLDENAKYQLSYNKGLYFKGLGKYDEAIIIFDNLNTFQEFSWNHYQVGIMKNLQGKTDESLTYLTKTFNLEPELKEDAKNFPELKNLWTNSQFIDITK